MPRHPPLAPGSAGRALLRTYGKKRRSPSCNNRPKPLHLAGVPREPLAEQLIDEDVGVEPSVLAPHCLTVQWGNPLYTEAWPPAPSVQDEAIASGDRPPRQRQGSACSTSACSPRAARPSPLASAAAVCEASDVSFGRLRTTSQRGPPGSGAVSLRRGRRTPVWRRFRPGRGRPPRAAVRALCASTPNSECDAHRLQASGGAGRRPGAGTPRISGTRSCWTSSPAAIEPEGAEDVVSAFLKVASVRVHGDGGARRLRRPGRTARRRRRLLRRRAVDGPGPLQGSVDIIISEWMGYFLGRRRNAGFCDLRAVPRPKPAGRPARRAYLRMTSNTRTTATRSSPETLWATPAWFRELGALNTEDDSEGVRSMADVRVLRRPYEEGLATAACARPSRSVPDRPRTTCRTASAFSVAASI